MALQQRDEEEDETRHHREEHSRVQNVVVHPLDGDSQEEDADGQFRRDHGDAVPDVTEPPILDSTLSKTILSSVRGVTYMGGLPS